MVVNPSQAWSLLYLHAKWPTVIWHIPSLTWITKMIAKPPLQFSSNNTLQPTPQYHFTATWDFHSWMMMENYPHNGFHAPSKSVTRTMSIASASVVATIQMDSALNVSNERPSLKMPNLAHKLIKVKNLPTLFSTFWNWTSLFSWANKKNWWNTLHYLSKST